MEIGSSIRDTVHTYCVRIRNTVYSELGNTLYSIPVVFAMRRRVETVDAVIEMDEGW